MNHVPPARRSPPPYVYSPPPFLPPSQTSSYPPFFASPSLSLLPLSTLPNHFLLALHPPFTLISSPLYPPPIYSCLPFLPSFIHAQYLNPPIRPSSSSYCPSSLSLSFPLSRFSPSIQFSLLASRHVQRRSCFIPNLSHKIPHLLSGLPCFPLWLSLRHNIQTCLFSFLVLFSQTPCRLVSLVTLCGMLCCIKS